MLFSKTTFFTAFILVSFPCFSQTKLPTVDTIDINGKIFEKVEFEAEYPGGVGAWREFLMKTLDPNTPIDNGAPSGIFVIIVQFVVDKEGNVSEIKPLTKLGYGMEQEVVKVIKKSGQWTPAMQNGRPVKAYRKQPVTFQVMEDGYEITTKTPYFLYTKTENELAVKVDKLKPQDVELTITQGSLVNKGSGTFIAKVNKPGRVIIRVFNKKKNKEVGAVSFEVMEKE